MHTNSLQHFRVGIKCSLPMPASARGDSTVLSQNVERLTAKVEGRPHDPCSRPVFTGLLDGRKVDC